ncbi:response regulator transcription factor [Amycolatopsis sp. K13G38]|uniref:Response regulator transcription factor n=1 Tax=Amycolatopsis acididurans TaxID=2724524 RepID=A0ABX1J672_9PSEU|nr:LuxR C-terminal-related transcriptional regulator [Amycolatopsis acididurans]NKQ55258.1 response regulator transcription factor [Amycolatopsis acididurans]
MYLDPRDYEHMLDLAASILRAEDPEQLWPVLAEELLGALGGTVAIHKADRWTEDSGLVSAWDARGALAVEDAARRNVRAGLPFQQRLPTSELWRPVTGRDLEGDAWRDTEAADVARDAFDADDVLGLPLAHENGVLRGFLIYHRAADFTRREREYAERIQPLLAGAEAHYQQLKRWRHSLPEPRKPAEFGLTARETAVLALLAEALPAAAVGRRLGVSVRTVHKHVENLYRKLGTTDRLSTVLRAQRLGLIADGARTPQDARHPAG